MSTDEKRRCGRSREGGAEREGEVCEEQGGRSRERSRKESGEGGAETERREIERHFQWDVCVQHSTGIHTNTCSLITSQLEASERVTHTLEGARRIDTATSRVTAINTHSAFINV